MRLFLLLFLVPFLCYAQNGQITGSVVTTEGAPVPGTKVFLNNSSYSVNAANNGGFTLADVKPGAYELIVTAKGYYESVMNITVGSGLNPLDAIRLIKTNVELKEVNISRLSKKQWNKYLEVFKDQFLGTDDNSAYCTIENPDILDIRYDKDANVVDVSSEEFLTVKNAALGLNVKFLLKSFEMNLNSGVTSYIGRVIFEELPDSENVEKLPWSQNRKMAYYGSPMHFFRSLSNGNADSVGFKLVEVKREDKKKSAVSGRELLSLYEQTQNKPGLDLQKAAVKADESGNYQFSFAHNLFVIYKNPFKQSNTRIYPPPNLEFSILANIDGEDQTKITFDTNGVVKGQPAVYQGEWSKRKLSKLLPFNYWPE